MDTVLHDLRLSLRLLAKSPGFAFTAILTLALGIGANTAIFSVVDGVLLRRAPFRDIDRLVMVWETDRNSSTIREPASVPDFLDFQARSRTLAAQAAIMGAEVNLTPRTGEPIRLAAVLASSQLFRMVDIEPLVGRTFTDAEDRPGSPRVALISESLWERSFGRDPAVVGEALSLNDEPYTIVGVVPQHADFGVLQILSAAEYSRSFADRGDRTRVDVWAPLQPNPEALPRSTHPIFVLGRLAPGAAVASAQQELAAIAADLERTYPVNVARGIFIEPVTNVVFGKVRPVLYVLLGAVALVLLVACVNVANLLLARGAARARDIAVRRALGAGTGRLARQFLVENIVLTLVAASASVALAFLGTRALLAMAPADVPRLDEVSLDVRVLVATLLLSVVVGLVFGMVPTLQARRVDLQSTLKSDGGTQRGTPSRGRLRGALVVSEVALTVMLAIGAALLIRSFWRIQQVDAGFQAEGVLKAEYQLPASRYPVDFKIYPNLKEINTFTDTLLRRAASLPGVESAAIAGNHPLDPGFTNSFRVVGREAEGRSWPEISVRRVTPGYFRTVGLPLVRGRLFRDADSTMAPAVTLINESAARRFFTGRDPLGAQIRLYGVARAIVGVVADEKFQGLAETSPIAMYLPLAQSPSLGGAVVLARTAGDPLALAPAVRGAIREIDPGLAVYGVEPLESTVSRSVSQRRFAMLLLGVFATVALVLAAIGIHGVLSYGVTERTREIGIRMALGAQPSSVLRQVVGQGAGLASLGLAIGLASAFALTRLLATLLFDVKPTDPATFVLVPVLLMSVALVASYFPARRATKVDPAMALRSE